MTCAVSRAHGAVCLCADKSKPMSPALASVLYAAAPRIDQLHPTFCGPGLLWGPGIRTQSLMANLNEKEAHQAWKFQQGPGPKNRVMTQPSNKDWNSHTMIMDPYTQTLSSNEQVQLVKPEPFASLWMAG
jgi:hypothetical protein